MKPLFGIRSVETYLDNAATTQVDPDVVDEMIPYLDVKYGNPETKYHLGLDAKEAIDKARERIAEFLGCSPNRVFFTSGGTESNNWAVKSIAANVCKGNGAVVYAAIEHSSILKSLKWMESEGCELREVGVDNFGVVKMAEYKEAVKGAKLVCIQFANNEIGTIQDIEEMSDLAHEAGAIVHVDAVQAFGKVPVFPIDQGADSLSISAHKIHGPKGVGALYIRDGLNLEPLIHGGGPDDLRGGTIPVHLLVGFGAASEKARCSISTESVRQMKLMQWAANELTERTDAIRNGHATLCLPNILNMRFPSVDATVLAAVLDQRFGICVATGAACSRGAPSHVLKAIGLNTSEVAASLRISIGRLTKDSSINNVVASMQAALKIARENGTI